MNPVQVAVLAALVGGTIVYTGYRFWRDLRAEREFFRALVEQVSSVLLPRGFRRMESSDISRSAKHTIARFEGPMFSLEVFWDNVDREVLLLQRRAGQSSAKEERIAVGSLPHYAKSDAFKKAAAAIVEAAARSDGNAFPKPARFEVRDVIELTNRGRAVTGTILAGRFRIGTRVWAEHMPSISFTISGIEIADDIANQRAWVGLVSADAPPLNELRQVLSSGSILTDTDPVAGAM